MLQSDPGGWGGFSAWQPLVYVMNISIRRNPNPAVNPVAVVSSDQVLIWPLAPTDRSIFWLIWSFISHLFQDKRMNNNCKDEDMILRCSGWPVWVCLCWTFKGRHAHAWLLLLPGSCRLSWCQVNDLHSSSHTDAVVSYSVLAFFSENTYSLNWLKSRLKMWVGPNLCPLVPFVAVLQVVEWRSRRKSLTRYECVHFIPWLTSYSPVRFVPAALPCSVGAEDVSVGWRAGVCTFRSSLC